MQQVALARKLFHVTEHRARRYRCVRTGRIITASLPAEVAPGGLVGPRLSTLTCYLSYPACRQELDRFSGAVVVHADQGGGEVLFFNQAVEEALDLVVPPLRRQVVSLDPLGQAGLQHPRFSTRQAIQFQLRQVNLQPINVAA